MTKDLNVQSTWVRDPGNHNFWTCPSCGREAYWDTDYGQQLFDFCPYCGEKLKNERTRMIKL